MFVITVAYTSEEKLIDIELIGYFETHEAAKEYLLDKEFKEIKQMIFDKETEAFVRRDVYTQLAHIEKLEKMG